MRPHGVVEARAEIHAAEVPIAVVTEVGDVVVPGEALPEKGGGAGDEAVVVELHLVLFPVAVVHHGHLGGVPLHGHVLPVEVPDVDVVVPDILGQVIQADVRVLLEAPKPGQVVLEDVVVPGAEETHPGLLILEQKAPEVGGEGLDTHAEGIEVIAIGHVPQVPIHEEALDAQHALSTHLAAGLTAVGGDLQNPPLVEHHLLEVQHGDEAEFPVRRSEGGIPLVQHKLR